VINSNKSFCLCIGPRHDVQCGQVIASSGQIIPWENEVRYLGIYITRSREFKCSLDIAKQSFYRAANAIFGKVGRHASEEVILQLVSSKCVPVLLYGLEACPLNKTSVNSLDFVIDRFFMKLFKTNNIDTVRNCQKEFAFELPSVILARHSEHFLIKYKACDNAFCKFV